MILFWRNEITGSNHLIHAQKCIVPFNIGMAFVGNLKKNHLNSAELKSR